MTKEEFQKLTTIFEMSDEDFEKVNSAYMELPNMDKQEFCKLYTEDMPRLLGMMARVISNIRRVAKRNIDCIDAITPRVMQSYHEDTLEPLADALDIIEESIGPRRFIQCKARYSSLFSDEDYEYLVKSLQ
nr:MAG TPA: hypothetical protein [Caudoviricetes sp.]